MPKKQPKKPPLSKLRKKPSKRSVTQKVKAAKRKRAVGYVILFPLLFMLVLGVGYYLGSLDYAARSTQRQHPSSKQIFLGIKEPAPAKQEKEMRYDEAGLDIIGRLIQKQDARRKRREQAKKKESEATTIPQAGKRPRLVIIIDDVSQAWQIKAIQKLGYPVTPSIFPPSEMGRHSNRLAEGLKHFMIHLPMQSGSAKMNRMQGMLRITDSSRKMKTRAREIRRLFPHGKYINNHTGSVFTSNYSAMKRMYGYLREEGFVFVDSRTSGSTKVKKIAKAFGDRYIVRDVFIDNTQSAPAIRKQLAKAVKIAKRRGYAIAIGHPHKATLKVLTGAKKLLKGVTPVYIDELYR